MNVFRYELRQYRRGLLGWAVSLPELLVEAHHAADYLTGVVDE